MNCNDKHIVVYKNIANSLIEKLENQGYRVSKFDSINSDNYQQFIKEISTANGLLGTQYKITKEILDNAPLLQVVSTISVGYDNFDLKVLNERSIPLMHTPNVLNDSMADLMMGLMLSTARKLVFCDKQVRENKWTGPLDPNVWFGLEVHHKKVGIIGMGRIGMVLAKRCKMGFDMNVSYYSRNRHEQVENEYGAKHEDLDTILSTSDFICCILPSSPETNHFFSAKEFAKMKSTAIFINAGRGSTVNQNDLYDALSSGKIAGAGLDVFEKEPVEFDSKLFQLNNIVLVPHIGTSTVETQHIMAECAVDNLISALSDNFTGKNCVNYSIIKK